MIPHELCAAAFAAGPMTIGVEEELMLLDAETLDLAPRAPELLAALGGDPRFKLELPAAQLEIVTPPGATVGDAVAVLAGARRDLAAAGARLGLRFAGAGAHPFAAPLGALNDGARYDATAAEYGDIARRQLVCGLHVHVAAGDTGRAVAVHDALRSHLPELAALAANAPFHAGADTGLASIRPKISEQLPRQGVPPALGSWEALADELRWGAAAGVVPEPRRWWWELRLHPLHGTVEVRVPDTQATVGDAGALAAVVHALVARLAERHTAGEALPVAPTWRIEENRWSACRSGVHGTMADLVTGAPEPTRDRIARLLDELAPVAERLGCATELARAHVLLRDGGPARRQRDVAAHGGVRAVTGWLAERFED
jgi:carboxylate-amine ligase